MTVPICQQFVLHPELTGAELSALALTPEGLMTRIQS